MTDEGEISPHVFLPNGTYIDLRSVLSCVILNPERRNASVTVRGGDMALYLEPEDARVLLDALHSNFRRPAPLSPIAPEGETA